LPALDKLHSFLKEGSIERKRVVITDGGVYDNLGVSCLEPDADPNFSLHAYPSDYIICCNAGHGQLSGNVIPYGFMSRTQSAFSNVFRKVQDAAFQRLHKYKQTGAINGFILPYLGQQDSTLPKVPTDFVSREQVVDYPTNFSAMTDKNIQVLSKRGEQLTELLLKYYCPELVTEKFI
jgi:NTE family protein